MEMEEQVSPEEKRIKQDKNEQGTEEQSQVVKEGKCFVIGAGDLTVTQVSPGPDDLVIAVDGGLSYCSILGVEPDYLIGDFDSISDQERDAVKELKKRIPDQVIELCVRKNDTDMLAALKLGLEKGYRSFLIYGGTGGRLDHTLANIQCLLFLKKKGAVGYLMDGNRMIFVIKNEEVRFRKEMEGYLSLFTLGQEAVGVTIQGMKYPLDHYKMCNDYPIGISNEFIGEEGSVCVEDGELVGMIQYTEV